MSKLCLALVPLALVVGLRPAHADEGMWTFNSFPTARVATKYKFTPDARWLDHVRLSSARIAGGCSASFVSGQGLVLTNHHCAHECIEQVSSAQKDYVKNGFYARTPADELKCPAIELNQLVEISDVTARISKATKGLADKKYNDALKAEMTRIEKECQTSARFRCDVVTLYHGGAYNLYKYRRFQDVRLVFAPEFAIAFFGGDPDNFMFPRYDLDMSFLRVYEDGKPAATPEHFAWSPAGAKDGELTFVTGHPGGTSRHITIAELEYQRDHALPDRLFRIAEWRGILTEFQRRGPEQMRVSNELLFSLENGFKALKGRLDALQDKPFFASKVAEEQAVRAAIAKDPAKQKAYGGAFDAIAKAQARLKEIRIPYRQIEIGQAFASTYFDFARTLVRGAEERAKPNEKRLREYRESALPAVQQQLMSAAPIHDDLEIVNLSFSLSKMRELLGADHPFVRKVLGKQSPEELAARLVKGTKLRDLAVRKQLWDGGKAAVAASQDPFIQLVRVVDPDARALRKTVEDQIDPVFKKNHELLAKARLEIEGMGNYPDATFTLRLSYGQVKGYKSNGRFTKPFTDLAGAFARDTGRAPFALPP
ncbi:MAG TPA: S46 family peptidase, partial [Polyangia bacterium]